MSKLISIVVPMYNEHEMVDIFFTRIKKVISDNLNYEFEVVAVNDGSKDNTLDLLKEHKKNLSFLKYCFFIKKLWPWTCCCSGIIKG